VGRFREIWERLEKESLIRDRDRRLRVMELDREFLDGEGAKQLEEEEKALEEMLTMQIEKGWWEMKYADREEELKDWLLK